MDNKLVGEGPEQEQATDVEVLNLSTRAYNCLRRAGITTVGQVAALSDDELLEIRHLGIKVFNEIRAKLGAYLTSQPLPEAPASIEVLDLSCRTYNLLWRNWIRTVDQLVHMSSEQIRNIRNAGDKTVEEVEEKLKAYLAEQPLLPSELPSSDEPDLVHPTGLSPGDNEVELSETTLDILINDWLVNLDERKQQIIRWRYGLDSERLTLEQVGQRLGLTRERVRQIQNRAKALLKKPHNLGCVEALKGLLVHLLTEAGGLMSSQQLDLALRQELITDKVDPVGVARLIFELDTNVKWVRNAEAWGLTKCPLAAVDGIQQRLAQILEGHQGQLSVEELLADFKATRFYRNRSDDLNDAFILACLMTHPEIEVDDSTKICGLTKWATRKLYRILHALQQIGRPARYSVIADRVNNLLPPDQHTTARSMQAFLNRYPDIFVHLGRGVYWLRGHLQEETSTQPQADFGDVFGVHLATWQAELDRQQSCSHLDTHAEVDILRNLGLDFFTD